MLRRQFLQWITAGVAAAGMPLLGKLEALAVDAPLVLAVEASTPYWMLELQAYDRLYRSAWAALEDGTLTPTRRGSPWLATFPSHPAVDGDLSQQPRRQT